MASEISSFDTIFCAAIEIGSAESRAAFVAEACGGEVELRRRVEKLVAAHFQAGSFLEGPTPGQEVTTRFRSKERPSGSDEPPTEAGLVIRQFKLLEPIGEGGMGTVYMAEQTHPVRRKVALKVIKPGMDTKQVIARFEAERQALALMDHPNIAKVLDAGTTESGRPYFVMELVRGIPITDYCDREHLSIPDRLDLFVLVCRAVQHAHQKGIIHRDIKPSNVLITLHDGAPVPKVIDFGIAKAIGRSLTDKTLYTGFLQLVGTPLYMSPEQAELSSADVDTRSDIYSLGVLLYELLTGTTPFDSDTLKQAAFDEMRRIIREEEPPRPSTRVGKDSPTRPTRLRASSFIPHPSSFRELDWIVMRALEKDRRRRYETANDFAADVMRYLTDRPVEACPPSNWYRLQKFVRRNRASVLVAACVVFGSTVFGVTVARLQRQREIVQSLVEGEVRLALREADLFGEQRKWAEATAAANRAQGLLQAETADGALRQSVDRRRKDLMLAAELEQIFTEQMLDLAEGWWSTLSNPGIDHRYAEAFQKAGIDVQRLSVEAAADIIRERGIRMEIANALDCWTCIHAYSTGKQNKHWKKLQQLATAVDPDPFRVKLRKVWADFNDPQKIVASPELLEQPMPVIMSLAMPILKAKSLQGDDGWKQVLLGLHRRNPQDFWVNFELGSESLDPVDAVRFNTAAVAIRPGVASVHLGLGTALHKLGRLDDAIASFYEAKRLGKDYFDTHLCLGQALAAKGRWDEAIACYEEGIRLVDISRISRYSRRIAQAYNNLGLALWKLGKRDDAITAHREAIKFAPERPDSHLYLGEALYLKGVPQEAIAAFEQATKVAPKDPNSLNHVAWFWATSPLDEYRDPARAIALAKKAVALAPTNGEYWNTLGVAHYRRIDWTAAIEALSKSVQLSHGGQSADFFFLAMAHWQCGEKSEAQSWYEKGVAWMEKSGQQDDELKRFRSEAAALLGLSEESTTGKDHPPEARTTSH
jgi:serine/threonine protein kinase/tetratricopeptide (TPR) repeat protein